MSISLDTSVDSDDYYFPVDHPQIRNLVGVILTHIEAMGLPERAEKANKDLAKKAIYSWFNDVQENSMTSYRGCIAPIQTLRDSAGRARKYVWLADGEHAVSVNRDEDAFIAPTMGGA